MRVAINAWFIAQLSTGSGQYLFRLLFGYPRYANDSFLFCTTDDVPDHPTSTNLEWSRLRTPFDRVNRHLAKLWFEQIGFPRAARRWDADLIHTPYWGAPFCRRIPVVVTIHDLIPLLLPEYQGGVLGKLYNRLVSLSARRATYVLTDSEASRQDIIHHLHIPPERVEAIWLAAEERFRPVQDGPTMAAIRQKYNLPERYLLYLGGFDRRKNVPNILKAYSRLDIPGTGLVIAGKPAREDSAFFPDPQRIAGELGILDRVRFTGWIDEQDKPALYSGAVAFVFPSCYEGFGLPPLEAMSCGTPVIISDRGSLPEIVGKAGLCVKPDDVESLAGRMRELSENCSLCESMRKTALAQAQQFNWDRTVQKTMAAYERTINLHQQQATGYPRKRPPEGGL